MSNSFNYAQRYLALMDEVYKYGSKSSILDATGSSVKFTGVDTLQYYKTTVQGLGKYDRDAGYVDGSVTGTWEALKLTQDRGRKFNIDAMDQDETLNMALPKSIAEFIRLQVVPEVDAYTFAKLSGGAGKTVSATLTSATVVAAIDTATAYLDDKEVPEDGRILFVSPETYQNLKGGIVRTTLNGDGKIDYNVEMFDNMRIIKVPKGRFNTAITLNDGTTSGQTAGGYTATGSDINFMIVHPSAIAKVVKHNPSNLISPDANQSADGWIYKYRLYHDTFIFANKVDGVYLHSK